MLWKYKDPENLDTMTVGQLRKYQMNQLDKAIEGFDTLRNVCIFLVIAFLICLFYITTPNIIFVLLYAGAIAVIGLMARIFKVQRDNNIIIQKVMLKIFIENGISENSEELLASN